jgi:hypothetical protein
MLTEVIDDADMTLAGPPELIEPLSEAEQQAAGILDEEPAQVPAAGVSTQEPAPTAPAAAPAGSLLPQAAPEQASALPQPSSAPAYPIPLKPAAGTAPAPVVARSVPAAAEPAKPEAQPAAMNDEEWQRMERRVRERILGQLLSRTDALLEERIRASLTGVVEQAVEGLAASLRLSLHKTLEDVVSRAVAQEITRLQSSKK